MADEPGKPRKPPNLPPLPGGNKPPLPGKPPLPSGAPPLPGLPRAAGPAKPPSGMPPLPGASGAKPPVQPPWMQASGAPPAPPPQPPAPSPSADAERKIAELEMKLQQEREKVLLASLKSSEEAAVSSRVEASIKEVQEKLRRDRRDSEREETRLKLEAKVAELENRMAQERETWVATLRNQMQGREVQDKELESHFTARVQEMERRWLEEKAHWQRVVLSKDEEIRNARNLAEKLKGVDLEYQKLLHEKKFQDERFHALTQENATLQARVSGAAERERDYFQLKAEVDKARDQAHVLQERFREREERLLADNERLQSDIMTAAQRARAEFEMEARRIKEEADGEVKKARAAADLAGAALQRMRAVSSALERQVAALRVQAEESRRLKDEVNRVNERYKGEFLVLQRKWQERETEIRKIAQEESAKHLEVEKTKIKMRAQEEIQERVRRVQEQVRKELEAVVRADLERSMGERQRRATADLEEARTRLEAELKRKQDELEKRDSAWQERILKKESELLTLRASLDEARARSGKEEEWKAASSRERLETERRAAILEAELGVLRKTLAETQEKMAEEEKAARVLLQERRAFDGARLALEEKARHASQEAEELRARLAAQGRSDQDASKETGRLEAELEAAKAETARAEEAWRQKLEMTRRDLEARIRELEASAEAGAKGGAMDRLKDMFKGKKDEPLA